MSLSSRVRYCGRRAPSVILHVDHIVARANGGSDDPENLIAACITCNLGKHTSDVLGDEADDGWLNIWATTKREALMLLLAFITGIDVERLGAAQTLSEAEFEQVTVAAERLSWARINITTPVDS